MEDEKIIGLYWERNKDAITETSSKYGKLFFRIASNILLNHEDSEECVESEAENRRIEQLIDTFLCQIGEEKRNIFLCRYWYLLWFLLPLSYF